MHKYLPEKRGLAKKIVYFRKKGSGYILRKFFYSFIFPLTIPFQKSKNYAFGGQRYSYFYHAYNTTWANERAVEIPIFADLAKRHEQCQVLEIGNVLGHYIKPAWDIVDKYETGKNIINQDILSFQPVKKYDLILSISTFEHIGFDDESNDPNKVLKVIANLRKNVLNRGGQMFISIPLGYNKAIDHQIFEQKFGYNRCWLLKRNTWRNHWSEIPISKLLPPEQCRYHHPYQGANYLAVLNFKN